MSKVNSVKLKVIGWEGCRFFLIIQKSGLPVLESLRGSVNFPSREMSYHWLLMMPDYRRSVRSPVSVKSWHSPEFIYILIFDLEQYLQCNQPPTINHIYQDILWSLHSEMERFISTTLRTMELNHSAIKRP